jgi:hypothetical protein
MNTFGAGAMHTCTATTLYGSFSLPSQLPYLSYRLLFTTTQHVLRT